MSFLFGWVVKLHSKKVQFISLKNVSRRRFFRKCVFPYDLLSISTSENRKWRNESLNSFNPFQQSKLSSKVRQEKKNERWQKKNQHKQIGRESRSIQINPTYIQMKLPMANQSVDENDLAVDRTIERFSSLIFFAFSHLTSRFLSESISLARCWGFGFEWGEPNWTCLNLRAPNERTNEAESALESRPKRPR